MSAKYSKDVNKLLKKFPFPYHHTWCNSTPWLMPKRNGGLEIINIQEINDSMLTKVAIELLTNQRNTVWRDLAVEELGSVWNTQSASSERVKYVPDFWENFKKSCQKILNRKEIAVTNLRDIAFLPFVIENKHLPAMTLGDFFVVPIGNGRGSEFYINFDSVEKLWKNPQTPSLTLKKLQTLFLNSNANIFNKLVNQSL